MIRAIHIRILAAAATAAAALAVAGCKQTEDLMTTQQTAIVRYLESSHQPRLISEEAARESLDEQPQYYSVIGHKAYRYIANMYYEGREQQPQAEEGDTVEISFDAYVFNYSSVTNSVPYWSNRAATIAALEQLGGHLDPQFWSTEPLAVTAGKDAVYGVSKLLVGCRQGDTVEAYMTYQAAYGNRIVGLVPKESPVAWLLTVEKVIKH